MAKFTLGHREKKLSRPAIPSAAIFRPSNPPDPLAPKTIQVGTILRNRYRVLKQLGSGGFSNTYLAEDIDLPCCPPCVIKHLEPKDPDPETFPVARRLFDREAKVLHRLGSNHSQIPQLLAYFEENHEFYLVEEFVAGSDLCGLLRPGTRLPEAKVIQLLREVLEVLVFVHQHRVVHRDINPSNLMRRQSDGRIVLIDFGAVKELRTLTAHRLRRAMPITESIGTPGYMPSEQANGNPKPCSDLYALGMVGLQALTGKRPEQFPRNSRTLEIDWPRLFKGTPLISHSFANVLRRMVLYDFRQRYQSAAEVLVALSPLAQATAPLPRSSPRSSPPSTVVLQSTSPRKHRWLGLGFGTASASAAAVVFFHPSFSPTPWIETAHQWILDTAALLQTSEAVESQTAATSSLPQSVIPESITPTPSSTPGQTANEAQRFIEQYVADLNQGHYADAWDALSAQTKAQQPGGIEEFIQFWETEVTHVELAAPIAVLNSEPNAADLLVSLRYVTPTGLIDEIAMYRVVRDRHTWRIAQIN